MNRWFAALILAPIAAGPAYSAPLPISPIVVPEPKEDRLRGLKFRIVEDPVFAPSPVHNSGMIAHTPVAPNASIGIGLLKASPRKLGTGEFRQENGPPGSRKAAIRFTLKF